VLVLLELVAVILSMLTPRGPEYGFYNLAVFYGTCNFNCLFCQNWHFRENVKRLTPIISAEDLAAKA